MGRRKKVKQPFNIPTEVLDRLDEMCMGGWFLFTYDDQMNYRVYNNFDNEFVMKSLKADVIKWFNSLETIEQQGMIQDMLGDSPAGE